MASRLTLNITSIRIIETCHNYEPVISALAVLDRCISNDAFGLGMEKGSDYGKILESLFTAVIENKEVDPYIMSTLRCFVNHKKVIKINISDLEEELLPDDESLYNVILFKRDEANADAEPTEEQEEFVPRNDDDCINLIKPRIIQIFKGVDCILIMTGSEQNYAMSIVQLLAFIRNSNVSNIQIGAETYCEKSWVSSLWSSSEATLIEKCNAVHFDISFEKVNEGSYQEMHVLDLQRK